MKKMRLAVVGLIISTVMVGVSFGAVTVPFTDSFEGAALGADWATNGTGAVTIAPADATPGGGAKSCVISNDALQVDVTSAYNVWAQVYAKAAGYDGDPADVQIDDLAAVFFITTDGDVRVMDGDGANGGVWTNVASLGALTDNKTGWEGFVVHLDYVTDTWDIYHQTGGEAGEATLTRLATNLGFRKDSAGMTSVEVSSELTASVDEIGLIQGYSDVGGSAYETVKSRTTDHTADWTSMVVGDIDNYSAVEDLLNDDAGGDLMMGMVDGDHVHLYLDDGFNTYDFNGGTWDVNGGAAAPGTVHLGKGQSWWVEYATTSTSNLEFWAEGFRATGEDVPDMIGETINLWGENESGAAADGWSHTVYGGSTLAVNNSGLPANLDDDTWVYIALPDQEFNAYFVRGGQLYNYNGSLASLNLPSGAEVWVRNLTTDADWIIQ